MAFGQDPFNPSRTLPTLAPIQQRRRELLAYQAGQEAAQALATLNQLDTEEDTYVPEEASATQEQEDLEETGELQQPHAEEESEPSVVLPPRSSAPPPPALDAAAFHGVAGSLVRTLAPHTEADPAAVLLSRPCGTDFGNGVPHARKPVPTSLSHPSSKLFEPGRSAFCKRDRHASINAHGRHFHSHKIALLQSLVCYSWPPRISLQLQCH
jgi:hypothetical protein